MTTTVASGGHIPSAYRRSSSYSISSDEMMDNQTASSYNHNHTDNGSAATTSRHYPTSESHLVQPGRYNSNNEQAYNVTQYQRELLQHQQQQRQPQSISQQQYPRDQYEQSNIDTTTTNTTSADYYTSHQHQHQHNATADYYPSPNMSELDNPSHQQYSPPLPIQFGHSSDRRAAAGLATTRGTGDNHFEEGEHEHKYGGYGDKGQASSTNANAKANKNGAVVPPPTAAAGAGGMSSIVKGYGTPHQIAYLSVVLIQTLATAAMIAVVWAKIRAGTPSGYNGFTSFFSGNDDEISLRRRTITVYLAIFLFGSVFEIITAIDALRLNNTIQLIGVCCFVIAMMVYSALLDGQIENAISVSDGYSPELYTEVRPYIIAMPIILGSTVLVLAYFTYKLYRDFGWEVLHLIGADRKLKRIYTKYQIFVCLVKFDFFFFVGFSLQYMILVLKVQEAEFIITIIAFPFTMVALIFAVIAVRRENKSLSYVIFIAELCALAYFIFKFFRLFQPSQAFRYQNSRKTLAVFSALAIVMLLLTFWCSILCFINYDQGLKNAVPGYFGEHRASRRNKRLARKNSSHLSDGDGGQMLDERPPRMSID